MSYDPNARFDHFNALLWGGTLPKVPVRAAKIKNFDGQFRAKIAGPSRLNLTRARRLQLPLHPSCRVVEMGIVLSSLYKRAPHQFDGILVHEMVHLYVATILNRPYEKHGTWFLTELNRVRELLDFHVPLQTDNAALPLCDSAAVPKQIGIILLTRLGQKGPAATCLKPDALEKDAAKALFYWQGLVAKGTFKRVEAFLITDTHWTAFAANHTVHRKVGGNDFYAVPPDCSVDTLRANGICLFDTDRHVASTSWAKATIENWVTQGPMAAGVA